MKRILLLTSKLICYNSTFCFIKTLKKAFEAMQYEVLVFSYHDKNTSALMALSKQHFAAVIDFNSSLPCFCDETNQPILDSFEAPFFHYILDHPLYHHKALNVPLKNYYVICLDLAHQKYLQTYYPHIKEVLFLPLFGIPSSMIRSKDIFMENSIEDTHTVCTKETLFHSFQSRPYPLLFTGTYTPLDTVEHLILSASPEIKKEFMSLIDLRIANLSLTMEETMTIYTKELGLTLTKEQFKQFLFSYYPVDVYMSAYVRKMVISYLLDHEIPVHVAGHGWDSFSHKNRNLLHFLGEFSYEKSLDLFDQAQISLNIMPGFTNGAHDRIFNAMMHRSVACTDHTDYLSDEFQDKKELLLYDLKEIQDKSSNFANLLAAFDMQELFCIATNGYQKMQVSHLPMHTANKILSAIP